MGDITKELYGKFSTRYKEELQVLETEPKKSDMDGSNPETAVEKCLVLHST